MRNPRLFTVQPLTPGDQVVLKGNVAQHLGRVLRARSGDHIALFNGDGQEFAATINELGKQEILLTLGEASSPVTESAVHTVLGLCLSKGDRLDWAVQKATELGVGAIAPLVSDRVDFSIPENRLAKRVNHWKQVAISASEQCGRVRVPSVTSPVPLVNWVKATAATERWVLHCSDVGDATAPSTADSVPSDAALLIGPEGGLTNEEVAIAIEHGFSLLQLGPRILRTETAPVVALTALSIRWGEILN